MLTTVCTVLKHYECSRAEAQAQVQASRGTFKDRRHEDVVNVTPPTNHNATAQFHPSGVP